MRFARASVPKPSPPLARRMRNYRERAWIFARVSRLIPEINARNDGIDATGIDVQGSDHAGPLRDGLSYQSRAFLTPAEAFPSPIALAWASSASLSRTKIPTRRAVGLVEPVFRPAPVRVPP